MVRYWNYRDIFKLKNTHEALPDMMPTNRLNAGRYILESKNGMKLS